MDIGRDLIRALAGGVVEYLRSHHQFVGAGALNKGLQPRAYGGR